ncbi:PAS domain-containing protein, partial [Streptomyces misionensis]|uniref:PAS domain-containing protein n=1 Tax=Streptomyces misionensis TaxID=67331 RepID=UPI003690D189
MDGGAADEHLVREAEKIAVALGRMFPGLCEVVLHDLRDPDHSIRAIENNLSGRRVGDPATELGRGPLAPPPNPPRVHNKPPPVPPRPPPHSHTQG